MWTVAGSWRLEIKEWVHDSFCEAERHAETAIGPGCRRQKSVTILACERSFNPEGEQSFTEGNGDMDEGVFRSRRHGDSGLVPSELSIGETERGGHRFRKWTLVPLLLGCALFVGACADDSTTDNNHHRKHRHGSGHEREQMETVDRSDNSSNSSPAPSLAPGW